MADFSKPSARGPAPVGVRTVTLAGLTTEIWYPARSGSDQNKEPARYLLRDTIPEAHRALVPESFGFTSDAFRDLPVEPGAPLPVVVFFHGYGLFRAQSAPLATHWASRGFIVVAPDFTGITLADVMQEKARPDLNALSGKVLDALKSPPAELEFLEGRLDASRMALVGHSMGADLIAPLAARPEVKQLIALAEAGTTSAPRKFSTLVIGGTHDRVEPHERQVKGFARSPRPKRFVAIESGGHLGFSIACSIGPAPGGALGVLLESGVPLKGFVGKLAKDGCPASDLAPEKVWEITRYATTAALEETLLCSDRSAAALKNLQKVFPEVSAYQDNP